jgi:hypothetical protein
MGQVDLDRATKAAAREYARRCRESLRTMEWALKAGRWEVAAEQAMQASGEAGEAQAIIERIREEAGR